MPDPNTRDLKLIQYLNEAYGNEKQLETALEAHIAMTTKAPYRKRLKQHLTETKRHAREVERRIKKLGGKAEGISAPGAVGTVANAAQTAANKAAAAAQGPLHTLRGTGEDEKLLKNAKTEYASEAEEIATYTAIEVLAQSVGDKDTAKLAKAIRREEERMQKYLGTLIPQLTRAVAKAEIPAAERKKTGSSSSRRRAAASRSRSASRNGASASTARKSSAKRKSTSTRSKSSSTRKKPAARKASGTRSRAKSRA